MYFVIPKKKRKGFSGSSGRQLNSSSVVVASKLINPQTALSSEIGNWSVSSNLPGLIAMVQEVACVM